MQLSQLLLRWCCNTRNVHLLRAMPRRLVHGQVLLGSPLGPDSADVHVGTEEYRVAKFGQTDSSRLQPHHRSQTRANTAQTAANLTCFMYSNTSSSHTCNVSSHLVKGATKRRPFMQVGGGDDTLQRQLSRTALKKARRQRRKASNCANAAAIEDAKVSCGVAAQNSMSRTALKKARRQRRKASAAAGAAAADHDPASN